MTTKVNSSSAINSGTKLINIDWLTLNVLGIPQSRNHVVFKQKAQGTRQFKNVYEVSMFEEVIGVLVSCPYLPSLPNNFCQFKVENRLLYDKNVFGLIREFLRLANMKYVGISRVDLCVDFEQFRNGLQCSSFLKKFAANQFYSMSKSSFRLAGEKSNENVFSYLVMGGKGAQVRTILYNKSKELREVKEKEWIRKQWEQINLGVSRDVWRLEFSMKNGFAGLINKRTGEEFAINLESISSEQFIVELFTALCSKYFRFIKATNRTNHHREKSLDLLGFEQIKVCRINTRNLRSTNKMEKVYANMLVKRAYLSDIQEVADYVAVRDFAWREIRRAGLVDYIYNRNNWLEKEVLSVKAIK